MKVKTEPAQVWTEYSRGQSFNNAEPLRLVETVKRNENFYNGRQWEGLNAPDLDKPVFNILRRVVTFFISTIVSDDIAVSVTEFAATGGGKAVLDMLSGQFGQIMELSGFKKKSRDAMRDAAVDGDGCLHYFFDIPEGDEAENQTPGGIAAEILDNTNVFFGNPQDGDVQKQPWVIIQFRRFVDEVQEAARKAGKPTDGITADADEVGMNSTEQEQDKVTVLRKYYKKGGVVWYTEVTQSAVVRPPTRLGYGRYPIAWLPWEKIKNQYHGQAAITGMVPNQIFINKLFAMAMEHVKRMAFPKYVYNRTMFPGGWTNRVGEALGVEGDPTQAVANSLNPPDMSNQVLVMIDKVINYTRDTMGASDAALGNIKPDNTSAIVATQKATAMPLELQKMEFYQFVEDSVRIWLDMMSENYGVRAVEMNLPQAESEDGATVWEMPQGVVQLLSVGGEDDAQTVLFDFSSLAGMNLRLNVDIGASTYWSELMQVQTLDNLFAQKIITDPEVYLEMIPSAYIQNKHLLLEAVRKQKAQAEAAMAAEQGGELPAAGGESMMPAELMPAIEGGLPI